MHAVAAEKRFERYDAALDGLRKCMKDGFAAIRSEIADVYSEIADVRADVKELRGELRGRGHLNGK